MGATEGVAKDRRARARRRLPLSYLLCIIFVTIHSHGKSGRKTTENAEKTLKSMITG
jgi:hypothetical protein